MFGAFQISGSIVGSAPGGLRMASSIVRFWRQSNGSVHPADADVLERAPGIFNLDYPPPAFVGDIDNAPVIFLNGNGGYKQDVTPLEFPDTASIERAITRLHHPGLIDPADVSSYYARANYSQWLKSGELALVNAVAYRAPRITEDINRIARKLPSTQAHVQWLWEDVIPAARDGLRYIVVHRNRLWNLKRDKAFSGMHFTSNPVSEYLAGETLVAIKMFLNPLK
jgi:hypothetical protein